MRCGDWREKELNRTRVSLNYYYELYVFLGTFIYSVLLGRSGTLRKTSQVLPMVVKPTPHAMWIGTNDGHLFGFCHVTFVLLVAVKQHSCIESIVSTGSDNVVVFGQWACDESSDTTGDTESSSIGGFSVWRLHVNNIVSKQ